MTPAVTAPNTSELNMFEQIGLNIQEAVGTCGQITQAVWKSTSNAVHASVRLLKKAASDMDLTHSLMKIYTSVVKVASTVFTQLGDTSLVPASVKALAKVFEGVSEFFSARKWTNSLAAIVTGEATSANPIFGFPNFIALASKASGLVADVLSTARWLSKHGIITISNTIGLGSVFGRQLIANLKDVQDTAALTSLTLAIADKARVHAEKGAVSANDGLEFVKLGSKVASIAAPKILPGFVGTIASASATIVSSTIEVFQWGVKNIQAAA